jgi:hypothetical protein
MDVRSQGLVQTLRYPVNARITGFPYLRLQANLIAGQSINSGLARGGSGVIRKPGAAVGIYSTNAGVERTFIELKFGGFRVEDISVALSNGDSRIAIPQGDVNALGLASQTPAAAHSTLSWLIGIGAAVLLTADSIIVAGPIAAVFANAGGDGKAGELSDALVNLGICQREASYCEQRVRDGGSVVSVRPDQDEWIWLAARLLEKSGAEQVWSTDELPPPGEMNRHGFEGEFCI